MNADVRPDSEPRDRETMTLRGRERILVAVGASPTAERVIHTARRIADDCGASWTAAWVESTLTPLTDADRARLDAHLRLAEALGASIVHLTGANVADALVEHARDDSFTQIVVGRSHGFSWRDVSRGPLVQQLLRRAHDIDVHVVAGKPTKLRGERAAVRPQRLKPASLAWALLLVAVTTLLTSSLGLDWLAPADIVLVYFVVITVSAVRFGRAAAIAAAALSVAAYNFFFIPPFFTMSVAHSKHLLTFAMMFIVGVFVSTVAARLKRQEVDAGVRERRTQSLLALTKVTAAARDAGAAAGGLAEHAALVFQRETAVLLPNARGVLVTAGSAGVGGLAGDDHDVVTWAFLHGKPAGRGTPIKPSSSTLALPLVAHTNVEGVLVILAKSEHDESVLDPAQRELADAFARQTAAALELLRLAEESRVAALKRRTEQMRSALLSAVSHDLRTPLAAITGAATTLLDADTALSDKDRRALLDAIADQGFHLERLVASLLDMTRVESGALVLRREWVPLEEIVGSALARTKPRVDPRPLRIAIKDVPLLHVDPALFEQALVNLLDNAAKHTPADAEVCIAALVEDVHIQIAVEDTGPGLPDGIDVFEKFVRGPGAKAGGLGLGLAIAKSVIEAHGGLITATQRAGGGARFAIRLPPPPSPPVESS